MALDESLLALLACPSDDHAPLRQVQHEGADALQCTVCESVFGIDAGIPVMLRDDAVPGPNGLGVPASVAPGS